MQDPDKTSSYLAAADTKPSFNSVYITFESRFHCVLWGMRIENEWYNPIAGIMNNNDPLYQNCFLASYALFKVMYDKEQNIPSVISKFIKNIIISKRLRNFSEFDIKMHLKRFI